MPSSKKLTFDGLGITQCYINELDADSDRNSILKTMHRHVSYEVHILLSGSQDFEIGDKKITVSAGEFLLISPFTLHMAVRETGDYKKE